MQKIKSKYGAPKSTLFPTISAAKQLVERLKNKGYNAYITELQNRGKPWYRVSVGKYSSREEADKVVESLKSDGELLRLPFPPASDSKPP